MDELITLQMMQREQRIQFAEKNYGKRLFNFIRSRVKNNRDAEDILQDVWVQLSNLVDIELIDQLGSWLFKVSRNKITDKNRKHRPQSLDDFGVESDEGELLFPQELISEFIETEDDNSFFMEAFFTVLNELPKKQREAFVLNELEDMTLQEIADQSRESIKTIISRKRYAVAHLRKRLKN